MTNNTYPETLGHNLVADPSFARQLIGLPGSSSASGDWKKNDINGYSFFNDGGNSYVGLIGNNSIWQDIALPMAANAAAGTRPNYSLSCLYDATQFSECRIEVYRLDGGTPGTTPLYTGVMQGNPPPRTNINEVYQQAAEMPPRDRLATWHTLPEQIISLPADVTHVRVTISTPPEPGLRYLYIRDIVELLQLPALNVDILRLITQQTAGTEIVQPAPPFKLCHGASHRLEVKAAADDHWQAQKLSLLWMDDSGLVPAQYGLTAAPAFNLDDGDQENRYQPLAAGIGAGWVLEAAKKGNSILDGECSLGWGSYWKAEKAPFEAKVGDFRYDVTQLDWDGISPVIDANNTTTLTATVSNPFEPSRPLAGKEVVWLRNDVEYRRTLTDDGGRATLVYQPESGSEGSTVFTASCTDELAQSSVQAVTFSVFASSPWPDELDVIFDGKPVTDFNALAMRITRGSHHILQVKLKKPDGYFYDKSIQLAWPANAAPSLGLTLSPSEPQVMYEHGLEWDIVGGAESGEFNLQLKEIGSAALPMPLALKGVQMSARLADEAELRVTNAAPATPTIFRRAQAQTVSLVPKANSPLRNMTFDGWLTFVAGTGLSDAQMPATPAYTAHRPLTGNGLAWSLTGANVSGTFGVEMHVDGFTDPLKLDKGMLLSTLLADEAELKVANAAPTSPAVFRRAQAQSVSLVPKASSPLKDTTLNAWMSFSQNGNLTPAQIVAAPAYSAQQPMKPGGLAWSLTGINTVSGRFGVEIHAEGFLSPLKLEKGVLLSLNLADEADLRVANAAPAVPAIFRRAHGQAISLVPKAASPLGDITAQTWLTFVAGTGLSAAQMPAAPAYNAKRPHISTGLSWVLTGANFSGTFGAQVHMDGFTSPLELKQAMLLSTLLSDEAELKVGGAAPGNPTIFRRGQAQEITFVPKPTSPLGGATLNAWMTFIKTGALSDAQVPTVPAYAARRPLVAAGLKWSVTGANVSGLFGVEVHMEGFLSSLKLDNSMLMSPNLADEAELIAPALVGAHIFWRTGLEKVGIKPKSGSPLGSAGLRASLVFKAGNVTAAHMPATPSYGTQRPVVSDTLWWTFSVATVSGRFGLEVAVEGFTTPLRMDKCALLSVNLEHEADIKVDNVVVGSNPAIFRRSQGNKVLLAPKPGSALGDTTLTTEMSFIAGGLAQGQVAAVPNYGVKQAMKAAGAEWTLTGTNVSGLFGLEIKVQGLWSSLRLDKCGLISAKISDELEYAFNSMRVGTQSSGKAVTYCLEKVLSGRPQQLLQDLGASVWIEATSIVPAGIVSASPSFGARIPLTNYANYYKWDLQRSPGGRGGVCDFEIRCSLFSDALTGGMAAIFSENLNDDYDLILNGRIIPASSWPRGKGDHIFRVNNVLNTLTYRLKNSTFKNRGIGLAAWNVHMSYGTITATPGDKVIVPPNTNGEGSWEMRGTRYFIIRDEEVGVWFYNSVDDKTFTTTERFYSYIG